MKKVLRGALVAAGTFAAVAGLAVSASAADVDPANTPAIAGLPTAELPGLGDLPDINILNNACVAPWYWQGPINFLLGSQDGSYSACNDMEAPSGEGINIGENACILPWYWQGPINAFLGVQDGEYAACNG